MKRIFLGILFSWIGFAAAAGTATYVERWSGTRDCFYTQVPFCDPDEVEPEVGS